MKFVIGVFLIIAGCVLIPHSLSAERAKLPSLYEQEYGTVRYLLPTLERSTLNMFWAQEAIGTPEARELIKEMQRDGFKFYPTQLGILDAGFDERKNGHPRFSPALNQQHKSIPFSLSFKATMHKHGTKTLSILIGQEPGGVSSLGEVDLIYSRNPVRMWRELAKSKKIPDVINASVGYHNYNHPKTLSNINQVMKKTIWVNAAGNSFPKPINDFESKISDKVILVGSADPSGFPSSFSQISKHVVVLAPSDYKLKGINAKGKIINYGGTSGAAPMVTGVLADVKSILPSLTRDEVVYMLKKTSTRTIIENVSTGNGAGVVNHYKMLRVAQRLHEANFANNRKLLKNKQLLDDAMYDFSRESRQLTDAAELLLDATDGSTVNAEGFKKLRKAFFLDTDNGRARTLLADIYQKCGHVASSEFYHSPIKNFDLSSGKLGKLAVIERIIKKIQKRSIKSHNYHRKQELKKFREWLKEQGEFDRKEIYKIKQEIKTVADKFNQLPQVFEQENVIEVLDIDRNQMLETLIHSANLDNVSDKTMIPLLAYAVETNPEILVKPQVIAIIQQRASAIKRFTNNLGAHKPMLRKILRLLTK
ncbi:MAG: S8/S53 family peptidase [Pseudomonadota bacterium]|nr:S8/S53 family peptidase [Pseudomonadota bacterium]